MSIRVLLVDDEPDMRMLLRLTLDRTEDIDVVGEAASGLEAIDQLAALSPDVLLLDHMMPGGLSGIDTAARVLAPEGGHGDVRVVLFTAWATEDLARQAASVGIHRFLSKDEFARVADTIREVATV